MVGTRLWFWVYFDFLSRNAQVNVHFGPHFGDHLNVKRLEQVNLIDIEVLSSIRGVLRTRRPLTVAPNNVKFGAEVRRKIGCWIQRHSTAFCCLQVVSQWNLTVSKGRQGASSLLEPLLQQLSQGKCALNAQLSETSVR